MWKTLVLAWRRWRVFYFFLLLLLHLIPACVCTFMQLVSRSYGAESIVNGIMGFVVSTTSVLVGFGMYRASVCDLITERESGMKGMLLVSGV